MNITKKFNNKIKGILSGFDRIIINGYSRQLNNCRQFLYYMIQNDCNLVGFNAFAEEHTKSLCGYIEQLVSEQNRPIEFIMSSKISKDEVARKLFNESPVDEGLVCCISSMEVCDTMTVKGNKKSSKKILLEIYVNRHKANKSLAGEAGLEPTTFGFGDRRSTN